MIAAIVGAIPRPVWLGLAGIVVVAGAYWAGGQGARIACAARVEAARATLLSEISEGTNAKVEQALEARRRAERDHDAGRVSDDRYRRD